MWWDEKMLYLEHRFIIVKSQTIAAISVSRMCFQRQELNKVLAKYPGGEERPEYPHRLHKWIEALNTSSRDLI